MSDRDVKIKRHIYTFKPASYTGDEVKAIMSVKRGTYVMGVSVRVGEVFNGDTDPKIDIGDVAGDTSGFVDSTAVADVDVGTLGLYDGYGSYFATANGKLYTEDDTIDLTFTHAATGSPTTGLATVYIVYCELE